VSNLPPRVVSTPQADRWIARLTALHSPLMFHQSGGCCDGSVPMCYPRGEFKVGGQDVLLGHIAGDVPVWIGAAQFEYWRHTQVTIDAAPGRGAGMSLETPRVSVLSRCPAFSPIPRRRPWQRRENPRADSLEPRFHFFASQSSASSTPAFAL